MEGEMIMNRAIIVVAASVLTLAGTASAWASDKDDILAVLQQWNDVDPAKNIAACADDASVIDDVPPFEWRGPGACANWAKAYDKFASTGEITDSSGTLGKPKRFIVEGDRAYVVAPGTFSYNRKGKPVKLTEIAAFSLHKTAAGWKITSWSWATTNIS
jgi:ketosteroid isomerase-like protein